MAKRQRADSFDRTEPTVIYTTPKGDYRMVLRALDSWPEGYVEVEYKTRDAANGICWHHVESFSLQLDRLSGHDGLKRMLIELTLRLDSRLPFQIKPQPRNY